MLTCAHAGLLFAHPVPCPLVLYSRSPELTACDPTAIGGDMEVQTEADTRDHDVGPMSLTPCPLGSVSAGLVGVFLIQDPTIV